MSRTGKRLRLTYESAKMGATEDEELAMTKFLLLTKYGTSDHLPPMPEWDPADVQAHLDYLSALNKDLIANGELIDAQALTGPDDAVLVSSDGNGAPALTDGPFPEMKELLAGYQMVDVDSRARAIEIAASVSAAPGPGGTPTRTPIEVRQMMGGLPGTDF
jgi:hypothetical protein